MEQDKVKIVMDNDGSQHDDRKFSSDELPNIDDNQNAFEDNKKEVQERELNLNEISSHSSDKPGSNLNRPSLPPADDVNN